MKLSKMGLKKFPKFHEIYENFKVEIINTPLAVCLHLNVLSQDCTSLDFGSYYSLIPWAFWQ